MSDTPASPAPEADLTPAILSEKLQIIADSLAVIGHHIAAAHVQQAVDLLQCGKK